MLCAYGLSETERERAQARGSNIAHFLDFFDIEPCHSLHTLARVELVGLVATGQNCAYCFVILEHKGF